MWPTSSTIYMFALSATIFVTTADVRRRRSFGGDFGSIKDYPYMASLRRDFNAHFCGGSIIGASWILTASHCLSDENVGDIKVAVGSEVLEDKPELFHAVKNGHIHPEFSASIQQLQNDIALLQLRQPLNFSETVQPVKLGKIDYDDVVRVVAAGWGRYRQGRQVKLGDKLRFLEMTTLSAKPCQIIHATKNNTVDGKTQICAISSMGKSLCSGDSGAPLLDLANKRQIGVFSGFETCTGEFPTLYARVESYVDWINSITNLNLTLS